MTTSALKIRQLSELTKSGNPMPVFKFGRRLKDIRKSLGMTQKQVAKRLGITRQAVTKLEKNLSSANLQTLERYISIFNGYLLMSVSLPVTLEEMIQRQAGKTAERILKRTYANMALENQAPDDKTYHKELDELTRELTKNPNASLWEE
ncbi:helix-turn-helix domain-containing protein [bacterium]|nr:helix-turn-helix domain-containing protein [bacterium]